MAIWTLCTLFHFVPTSKIVVAMATKKTSENGGISDNGGAGRGPYCLTIALFYINKYYHFLYMYFV